MAAHSKTKATVEDELAGKEATVYHQAVPIHPSRSATCARRIADDMCPINHSVAKILLLLGDPERKATYCDLNRQGMTKENVPSAPVEFDRALREIFGPRADILEESIRNDIQAIVNSTVNDPDCSHCEAAWLN